MNITCPLLSLRRFVRREEYLWGWRHEPPIHLAIPHVHIQRGIEPTRAPSIETIWRRSSLSEPPLPFLLSQFHLRPPMMGSDKRIRCLILAALQDSKMIFSAHTLWSFPWESPPSDRSHVLFRKNLTFRKDNAREIPVKWDTLLSRFPTIPTWMKPKCVHEALFAREENWRAPWIPLSPIRINHTINRYLNILGNDDCHLQVEFLLPHNYRTNLPKKQHILLILSFETKASAPCTESSGISTLTILWQSILHAAVFFGRHPITTGAKKYDEDMCFMVSPWLIHNHFDHSRI